MTLTFQAIREGRAWAWTLCRGKKIVAGGYSRPKKNARADARAWLRLHGYSEEAIHLPEIKNLRMAARRGK
jgi:hypothetical protein